MIMPNGIEAQHQRFLESKLNSVTGLELSKALLECGLIDEATGIQAYVEHGDGARFALQSGAWAGEECIAGALSPLPQTAGQLWFDVVELCTMVLVPGRIHANMGMASWIRTSPVRSWQFRVFMNLVRWRPRNNPFMKVEDIMKNERFMKLYALDFVANVYHEEAVAYAHWFGKTLVSAYELRRAEGSLTPQRFSAMLPDEFRLWSENVPSDSEFVRLAVGKSSLYKSSDDEFEFREKGDNVKLADRLLFEEWDKSASNGFSTKLTVSTGVLRGLPMQAFEFVELANLAYRPG